MPTIRTHAGWLSWPDDPTRTQRARTALRRARRRTLDGLRHAVGLPPRDPWKGWTSVGYVNEDPEPSPACCITPPMFIPPRPGTAAESAWFRDTPRVRAMLAEETAALAEFEARAAEPLVDHTADVPPHQHGGTDAPECVTCRPAARPTPRVPEPAARLAGADDLALRLSQRLTAEVEPLLDRSTSDGGYDCCGCSSPERVIGDVRRILAEEADR